MLHLEYLPRPKGFTPLCHCIMSNQKLNSEFVPDINNLITKHFKSNN